MAIPSKDNAAIHFSKGRLKVDRPIY